MRNALFLTFWLFVCLNSLIAQNEFIRGKLMDTQTGEPIPFATIRIKDKPVGVISNHDGGFQIPKRFGELGDIIEISCIGYLAMERPISSFSPTDINILRLSPSPIELDEAVVKAKAKKALSARQIVRRAIKAIPDNYSTEPFSIVGYYRDYQFNNNQYVNLNEALVEVFDYGFDEVDSLTTKTGIYETKNNYTFPRDTLADKPYKYNLEEGRKVIDKAFIPAYGGNELTILRVHDAIRNYSLDSYSFVHTFKRDLLPNHNFSKDMGTTLNNEPLYVVRFVKLDSDFSAYGKLYISKINFAIHKLEYAVYDNNKGSIKPNKQGTNKGLVFEVITEYKENKNKMYLNYISFNNTFQVWEPPKFILEYIDIVGMSIVLIFNKELDMDQVLNKDNFFIDYKGKPLKIKKIEFNKRAKDKNEILIYPDMLPYKLEEILRSIRVFSNKGIPLTADILSAKVENLKDVNGNLIHKWTSKGYNQFREFFAQEVKPNTRGVQDTLYMKKYQPIFMDQPIFKPENMEDYWMNTPLKTVVN